MPSPEHTPLPKRFRQLPDVVTLEDFIQTLFAEPLMLGQGHDQRAADLNLGLGWIYYAIARVVRPETAVVIGSLRGFAPSIIGKALLDNAEASEVVFIDPSLADDFWKDPAKVTEHFAQLGVPNVRHVLARTQQFVESDAYRNLDNIGVLMIDGYHSAEQARFDYLSFVDKLSDNAVVMFHDSRDRFVSDMYGADHHYVHTVYQLIPRLQATPGLNVFSFPFGAGLTLVNGRPESLDLINQPFVEDQTSLR